MKTILYILIALLLSPGVYAQDGASDSNLNTEFSVTYADTKIKIINPDPVSTHEYQIYSVSGQLLCQGQVHGNYTEITTDKLTGVVIFTMNNGSYGMVKMKIHI